MPTYLAHTIYVIKPDAALAPILPPDAAGPAATLAEVASNLPGTRLGVISHGRCVELSPTERTIAARRAISEVRRG